MPKNEPCKNPAGHCDAADTEDEEDSEPIFGFLEETLATDQSDKVPVNLRDRVDEDDDMMFDASCGGVLVPSKGEPAGFISLASHVLIFMNKHLLTSDSSFVKVRE